MKCDICNKVFANKGAQVRHIATVHEGKKDHKCTDCGKAYGQSNDLYRHMKKVHNKTSQDSIPLI